MNQPATLAELLEPPPTPAFDRLAAWADEQAKWSKARDEARVRQFSETRAAAYADAFVDTMQGIGGFWPTGAKWSPTDYDNEQELSVFVAVRNALRMQGATDAQRWQMVEAAIRLAAHEYADGIAER